MPAFGSIEELPPSQRADMTRFLAWIISAFMWVMIAYAFVQDWQRAAMALTPVACGIGFFWIIRWSERYRRPFE